jgi:hypothetical protein
MHNKTIGCEKMNIVKTMIVSLFSLLVIMQFVSALSVDIPIPISYGNGTTTNSSYNITYQNKADYNFGNNNFVGTGNITATNVNASSINATNFYGNGSHLTDINVDVDSLPASKISAGTFGSYYPFYNGDYRFWNSDEYTTLNIINWNLSGLFKTGVTIGYDTTPINQRYFFMVKGNISIIGDLNATNLQGNLNCSYITGSTSDLCTITSGGGNPFNQELNKTSNVTFNEVNATTYYNVDNIKKNAFCEVKFGTGDGNEQSYHLGEFSKVNFHSLHGYILYNIGLNYNETDDQYVVPVSGVYRITTKIRVADDFFDEEEEQFLSWTAGTSYGQGGDIAQGDSPTFIWWQVNKYRNGAINQRISHFDATNRIMMITYSDIDLAHDSDLIASDGSMTIELLYAD